ncbi:MAG: hypothetical protein DBX46_02980 [Clostridiales bacterium]|jgi:hypothetical protein|nr:MAG: hypothetical protein DBX46_02980 [Clostridiales bacterium]
MEKSMLLHIGGDKLVDENDIVMILDYKALLKNNENRKAIAMMGEKTSAVRLAGKDVRTVIVTKEFGKLRTYFSPVYGKTLISRKKTYI